MKEWKNVKLMNGGLVCAISLFGLWAGTRQGAYGELYFRVENLCNSGYNKINPNRRLEDERSG